MMLKLLPSMLKVQYLLLHLLASLSLIVQLFFQLLNAAKSLLQCPTVTEDEALHRYVRGLRDAPRKWVQMRSPTTLHEA